jgi:uncharacterized membrane protein YfcA
MTSFAVALVAAVLIGLSLGLLGGGGSVLTVPVFVYLLGIAPKSAVAMSMPVVGLTSLVGAAGHWRAGNVHWRSAMTFGAVAMAGSFAGSHLARFLSGTTQLVLLGAVMALTALSMLRGKRAPQSAVAVAGPVRLLRPVVLVAALGVGVLTGLVGIGGGFLVVPALVLLADVPMQLAIGTSLVVIAMNAASGLAGYAGHVPIDWRTVAWFTALASVGILVGSRLSRHASPTLLRRGFALFLLAIAGFLFWQNRAVLGG